MGTGAFGARAAALPEVVAAGEGSADALLDGAG
jgi:hypothetical protein